MSNSLFQKYSAKHIYFYDKIVPAFVQLGLSLARKQSKRCTIIDLGCGDGGLIFALRENKLLFEDDEIWGVDISSDRINRLRALLPLSRCITDNILNVRELPDFSFDFVICSQVIEHVNDRKLLREIRRLLKMGGIAYVSSVIKKPYGVYFYFRNGGFRLDPTHVREYSSLEEFSRLISNQGFKTIAKSSAPIIFPIVDLVLRLFIEIGLAVPNAKFFLCHNNLRRLRKLCVQILGYREVEVLVRRK